MKIYRFPSPASRLSKRFSNLTRVRLALILALTAALSCLPFYVLAQNDVPVGTQKSGAYTVTDTAYTIYAGPNGETLCRRASPDEIRAMRNGQVPYGLRQINHLEKDSLTPAAPNAGLTIVLRATAQLDANPEAKAAFIAAAAKWEALIQDPITVAVDVDYGTTFFGEDFDDPNILGATSSPLFSFAGNYPEVRQRLINQASPSEAAIFSALPANSVPTDLGNMDRVMIGSPQLRVLGIFPPSYTNDPQTIPAPRIAFNSAFGFDFNPNDGITGNRTDFDAVAVHELGHLLGFESNTGGQELSPPTSFGLTIWDLFRFRPGAANLNNFGTAPRILSSGGTQVQFNGGPELGLSTGRPNGQGGDLKQASHWKADELSGVFIGIMDPTIARNVRETMTSNDQNAIDRFGYQTTPGTPPPNDNFVNAQTITGTSGTINATNAFATKEAGEPSHEPDGNPGGRSVWYRWTAPSSGSATLTTAGSNYDTLLAVYTGSSVNALTGIIKNDDVQSGVITTSTVTFGAIGGTTYHFAVDGFNGAQGIIALNFTLPGAATPTPTPTPGPNTVQFTTTATSATEAANTTVQIDLTVTRTGNLNAGATVNYATSDATASQTGDYEAALGTLQFAAFEAQKSIPLFIVDDAYSESPETFNITLSNPVACALGSPAAVTVTINSDDAVNGPNPVKDATFNTDFFVRQHYLDFFNRAPDAPGLAFWKNQIDECTTQECREIRRINVSGAFFLSIEFEQTGYLVERLYKTAYGDAVGNSTFGGPHQLAVPIVRYHEFLADTQQIGRGVIIGEPGADQLLENNKQALIAQFVLRARFTSAYPNFLTPTQFVDTLNGNAGNVLSAGERTQLINDLSSGAKNRAQVLRAVAEDADLTAAEKNRAFVLAQFFGYLRRDPNGSPDSDYTGYDFWLSKLNQFGGNFVNAEMVKSFIISGEYQGRFGP